MNDLPSYMKQLALSRSVFHSEADFQHSLAWLMHNQEHHLSVRLERPQEITTDNTPHRLLVDIFLSNEKSSYAIELKYKTKRLYTDFNNETFLLKNQSAQDLGRYDFLKDIERLEQLKIAGRIVSGYAVLLTNDSQYWVESSRNDTVDCDFRLHNNRNITNATLQWGLSASCGTTKGRQNQITIQGSYDFAWQHYSEVGNSIFKYLCVRI